MGLARCSYRFVDAVRMPRSRLLHFGFVAFVAELLEMCTKNYRANAFAYAAIAENSAARLDRPAAQLTRRTSGRADESKSAQLWATPISFSYLFKESSRGNIHFARKDRERVRNLKPRNLAKRRTISSPPRAHHPCTMW